MEKLNSLVDKCFALDKLNNPANIYRQFHQTLSDIFAAHDLEFDDPFIGSTKS